RRLGATGGVYRRPSAEPSRTGPPNLRGTPAAGDPLPSDPSTRVFSGVAHRRRGSVTNQDRVFLVVALVALAVVALATSVSLLLARRGAQLRAPLATALTFSLLALGAASGIGAIAVLQQSDDLAIVAGAVALIAALSLARVGMLRREH